jgi:hypothetical protein
MEIACGSTIPPSSRTLRQDRLPLRAGTLHGRRHQHWHPPITWQAPSQYGTEHVIRGHAKLQRRLDEARYAADCDMTGPRERECCTALRCWTSQPCHPTDYMRCQSIAADLRCATATAFVLCARHTYVCCIFAAASACLGQARAATQQCTARRYLRWKFSSVGGPLPTAGPGRTYLPLFLPSTRSVRSHICRLFCLSCLQHF